MIDPHHQHGIPETPSVDHSGPSPSGPSLIPTKSPKGDPPPPGWNINIDGQLGSPLGPPQSIGLPMPVPGPIPSAWEAPGSDDLSQKDTPAKGTSDIDALNFLLTLMATDVHVSGHTNNSLTLSMFRPIMQNFKTEKKFIQQWCVAYTTVA